MLALAAPAKLNLTLEILSRRADGYHALRSLMVPIGLYDRIELEPVESGAPSSLVVKTDGAANDASEDNLVDRALKAARVATPMRVTLEKRIPIGGGLGGGSSDAAAVLRAAMEGRLAAGRCADWLETARALGSDVPFFMAGTAALVEGAGERVTALGKIPQWWAVVVRPSVSVATREAYRLLDEVRARNPLPSRRRSESASLRAVDALQCADFAALGAELINDFHEPVLATYPAIAWADAALRAACGSSLLSGSGSCLFALFENADEARAGAERIDRNGIEDVFVAPFHADHAWR
jgi:4-diphosphocytidyl-2-C-methyl-D-erythritol kinase